jgi:predicted transcriptional regulator
LAKQDEVEVAVTWEDQKMINSFSWLNQKMHELEDEREELVEQTNKLDDAITEIMMGSMDAPVRYVVDCSGSSMSGD